ncbi:hypothetical protein Bca101_004472 [Brassica carinata]
MPTQTRTAEYIGLRGPSRGMPPYQTACYSFFHECSSIRVVENQIKTPPELELSSLELESSSSELESSSPELLMFSGEKIT